MARLADYSNDEGVSYPSVETIARQLGAGISTIRGANNVTKGIAVSNTDIRPQRRSLSGVVDIAGRVLEKVAAQRR